MISGAIPIGFGKSLSSSEAKEGKGVWFFITIKCKRYLLKSKIEKNGK
jgi:hypothetical protein